MSDWNPARYAEFTDLRLRPALDLLGAVGEVPAGGIVDLGCGAGVVGPFLAARFPGREIVGLDSSPAMREQALETGTYAEVVLDDIATHDLGSGLALIYANAALQWVPDHHALLPRLAQALAPGGWLAVQMPYQHDAPSHVLAREAAHRLAPERFPDTEADPNVLPPRVCFGLLTPFGEARVWMTEYMQPLAPAKGHPVRRFTQATYLRPYLDHFEATGQAVAFLAAYDSALGAAYPLDGAGRAWFPFRRLLLTLRRS
ncbi:methyltransferase domain-containing protein [Celeribacter indicus]|uniref:Trans-aconitate 2-methyltransferase n=1 Tax=Celeribacter indicus TaxID=1208324 RepID=A0A0B5DXS5_9RHOB|nr:methyltransferase domain-containing protein [Celeribacter indicus]AJE45915.1 trans-aconitate 2-methyltransferase [Celeribacter indicus]SDW63643.1 trans-aconitate 2-methyltransferase [Celeribacter indicus]